MALPSDHSIHVVGLGVQAEAHLPADAEQLLASLASEDIVVGSERQLGMIAGVSMRATLVVLPKLNALREQMPSWFKQGARRVVLLASGDPLCFGVGAWVQRHFEAYRCVFYPNVSSIQAACHQLGLSLQDVDVVSVHGRPLSCLRRHLHSNRTLALLTDRDSHPRAIAQECLGQEIEESLITVCERLGYPEQRVRTYSATTLLESDDNFDALNVVIIRCSSQLGRLPSTPGFADSLFVTDKGAGKGMITKREVRLAILSYLGAEAGDVIWDIGAGCGGVSVELAYWNRRSKIYAIEHNAERFDCLEQNRERFGVVQNVALINGRAPTALQTLPQPNRVFIGGSDGALSELLPLVWQNLPVNGVLLVSSVTDATQMDAMTFLQQRDQAMDAYDESVTLQIQRSEQLSGSRMRRPHLPVTLWRFEKRSLGKV